MSGARGLVAAVAASVLTAALYAAAYPPYRWAPCAWVALVPFLIGIRTVGLRAALAAAVSFPLLACALTIAWMPRAAATYYGQPFIVGIATFLAIALVMVAPYVVAFTLLYRRLARHPTAILPLIGGALWVCGEYARSYALTGNPFVLLGYSQAGVATVRQIADLTGVYGVSFVVAAVNVAVAELCLAAQARERAPVAVRGLACAAGVAALTLAYGTWRLATTSEADRPTAAVLLVQGNLDLGSQWRDELYGQNLDVYLRLTLTGMKEEVPVLAVWPENAMTFFIEREPLYRLSVGRVLSSGPTQLLAGGPHFIPEGDRYMNSAFLIEPNGEVLQRYDKRKLLPFAEYFPLPQLDVLQRSFGRVREFTPGDAGAPLPTAAGRAGILICNEAMFPEIASQRVGDGAEILVNLANDSWIADDQYAELAYDMAVFRAVEQRRYLIRSSTSGPSGVIDPSGETTVRSAPNSRGELHARVGKRTAPSVYARVGDVFAAVCLVLVVGGLLVTVRRRR